jgi:hypothetical protein
MLVVFRPSSQPDSMLAVTPEWPPGVHRSISSTTFSSVQFRASLAREDHLNLLQWLGLGAGEDFDSKEFSAADVSTRLSALAPDAN